jgi:hypothetical protein
MFHSNFNQRDKNKYVGLHVRGEGLLWRTAYYETGMIISDAVRSIFKIEFKLPRALHPW